MLDPAVNRHPPAQQNKQRRGVAQYATWRGGQRCSGAVDHTSHFIHRAACQPVALARGGQCCHGVSCQYATPSKIRASTWKGACALSGACAVLADRNSGAGIVHRKTAQSGTLGGEHSRKSLPKWSNTTKYSLGRRGYAGESGSEAANRRKRVEVGVKPRLQTTNKTRQNSRNRAIVSILT